jgi:RimJ/RimL family protein N-acetyltransferase
MIPERIATDRYELRRFGRRDADALTTAVRNSLPELQKWLPWAHPGYNRDEASSYIRDSIQSWREGRAYDYAIRDSERTRDHLGNASIWAVSRMGRTGEIGYWTRTDHTTTGIATEAAGALVRVGFEHLGFHKINLRIAVGNRPSERVAEKLGFTRDGILREELLIRGAWVDHTLYALLEQEWRAASRSALEGLG